jgi:hypothetical protein
VQGAGTILAQGNDAATIQDDKLIVPKYSSHM